jgi:predicted extracellular nuclease
LTLALFVLSTTSLAFADEFHVAFWNVENLFDLVDDPTVEADEEFTPQAPKRWTAERLEIKLNNLARIIRKMNSGRGPDVLGLCEVENRSVVEMLLEELAPLGRQYQIVHQDSPSDRGIDCALVYDSNVFGLADALFHFVDAERTRDIVEARLQQNRANLYVFVNHWPSRGNDEWQRCLAAAVLRKRLDAILAGDAQADIVLLGDFNDEPANVSLNKFLLVAPTLKQLSLRGLYDTTASIKAAGKGTYVWDNRWQLIDHVIVSRGLLDDSAFRWKQGSSQTIAFPEQFFHPRFPGAIPRPSRSYSDDDFHRNGYSDHLPVACVIVK